MNESTKVRQYTLELLSTRPALGASERWLEREVALSGYDAKLLQGELDTLESQGMAKREVDDIGVRKWHITKKGTDYVEAKE